MERYDVLYKGGLALDKLENVIIHQHSQLKHHDELCAVMDNILVYIVHLKFSVCTRYKNSEPRFPFEIIHLSRKLPESVAITELKLLLCFVDSCLQKCPDPEKLVEFNEIKNDLQLLLQVYDESWKNQQQVSQQNCSEVTPSPLTTTTSSSTTETPTQTVSAHQQSTATK